MGDRRVDPYQKWGQTSHFVVPGGGATGTMYGLPDRSCERAYFKPHPDNNGTVWLGFATGVAIGSLLGWPVEVGDGPLVLEGLKNLNMLNANFDNINDRLCWFILEDYPEDGRPI